MVGFAVELDQLDVETGAHLPQGVCSQKVSMPSLNTEDLLGVRPPDGPDAAGNPHWTCPACTAVHDRDYNAARNILAAGRAERRNARGAPVRPPATVAPGDEQEAPPPRHSRAGIPGLQSGEHVKSDRNTRGTRVVVLVLDLVIWLVLQDRALGRMRQRVSFRVYPKSSHDPGPSECSSSSTPID